MVGQETNPYEYSESSAPIEAEYVSQRPKGIATIGVIAMVLGALGAMGGVAGVVGPIIGKSAQQKMITNAEANPDNQELQVQADIQKSTMAIAEKYKVANLVLGTVMLLACITLLVSAYLAMKGSAAGRALLVTMCFVMLFCDLGKSILTVLQQREMIGTVGGAVTGLIQSDESLPESEAEQVENVMGMVLKFGTILAMVLSVGWFLIKAAFYLYASRYMSRDDVKAYYDPQAAGV